MEELRPGLLRWTARHPTWKQDVGCLAVETSDGLVLVDPLLGDEDVGVPAHAVITVTWHVRSAAEIVERWPDVRLWAPARKQGTPLRKRATPTDVFTPGDALPGGIETFETARDGEAVLWLPQHNALVFGDAILGDKQGGLRLCPQSWLGEGKTHADLRKSLKPLLDLPVELALPSHGDPVRDGAKEALEQAMTPARAA